MKCTNYALLAFSSLLRSILLKQICISPIQKTCQNFLLWWFSRDFLISDNLAYQKCFVLQRLLYSGFIFTAILLYVYWMNRRVLVWIHFNVCKGDTQTKTLKRVFADHIQSAFSSIHVFFKEKQKVIMSPFPTGIFWFVFNDWHHSWHNNGLRPRPHVIRRFLYPQFFLCGYKNICVHT